MEAQSWQKNWRTEKIFFDAAEYFDHLIAGIDSARKTIEFETYIFTKDELGDRVIVALKRAHERGVKVRLLVDGFGSPTWLFDYAPELERVRLDYRVFHPLRLLARLNKRNHRKVCVVDRAKAWVGGRNVCGEHFNWRDTSAYVEGGQVNALTHVFYDSWWESWSPYRSARKISSMGSTIKRTLFARPWAKESRLRRYQRLRRHLSFRVRVYSGFSTRQKTYASFFNKIYNAQKRIWITNAYFVPTQKIIYALAFAARNHVDVRVVVPKKADMPFLSAVSSALYQELLRSGVRIYEFGPQMMHAKTVLVDDWAIVGTTNLNHRSLLHDLEVEIVLSKAQSIATLENQFEEDLKHCHAVTFEDWKNRPLLKRFFGRLFLKLRYWI